MKNKIINLAYVFIISGVVMASAGLGGVVFIYKSIARENIKTPDDASIASAPVRGPLTLKAQADIIRKHMLNMSEGKTFAEMPRQIPKLDADGAPVLDSNGKPVMMANTVRETWITATTLITALNLGIMAYAFSGLTLFLGLIFIFTGYTAYSLGNKYQKSL